MDIAQFGKPRRYVVPLNPFLYQKYNSGGGLQLFHQCSKFIFENIVICFPSPPLAGWNLRLNNTSQVAFLMKNPRNNTHQNWNYSLRGGNLTPCFDGAAHRQKFSWSELQQSEKQGHL